MCTSMQLGVSLSVDPSTGTCAVPGAVAGAVPGDVAGSAAGAMQVDAEAASRGLSESQVASIAAEAEQALSRGQDTLIYTTRALITASGKTKGRPQLNGSPIQGRAQAWLQKSWTESHRAPSPPVVPSPCPRDAVALPHATCVTPSISALSLSLLLWVSLCVLLQTHPPACNWGRTSAPAWWPSSKASTCGPDTSWPR